MWFDDHFVSETVFWIKSTIKFIRNTQSILTWNKINNLQCFFFIVILLQNTVYINKRLFISKFYFTKGVARFKQNRKINSYVLYIGLMLNNCVSSFFLQNKPSSLNYIWIRKHNFQCQNTCRYHFWKKKMISQ